MALVKCSSCGHLISSRARSCPKCAPSASPAPPGVATLHATSAAAAAISDRWISPLPDLPEPTASIESPPSAPTGFLAKLLKRLPLRRLKERPSQAGHPGLTASLQEEPPEESLFYLTGEGRMGPVPLSQLYDMIADGELDMETPVSTKGTTDWLTFSQYLRTGKDGKASVAGNALGGMAWGVALAPAWGAMVPLAATQASVALGYQPLAYQVEMWAVVLAMNIVMCYLDYRALKKSGRDLGLLGGVLCLVVPLYLCRRERTLPAKTGSLFLWSAAAATSLAGFLVVNTANVPILTVIERMIHG